MFDMYFLISLAETKNTIIACREHGFESTYTSQRGLSLDIRTVRVAPCIFTTALTPPLSLGEGKEGGCQYTRKVPIAYTASLVP